MRISKMFLPLFAAGLLASSAAYAGTGGGNVTSVVAIKGGTVVFKTATHTGYPICEEAPTEAWAIDTTTVNGKAQYALLLTAINSGMDITVAGTNTCDIYPTRETVQQLIVNY
ncbi:hypothetical protein ACPPVV_10650 [Rhodanobacter sp. Col0626]|uniref:hypothetical protein n=1 Tax=Rhodanobacter sp. Col0626 TaxID=3415679 RepID=UPI003CE88C51